MGEDNEENDYKVLRMEIEEQRELIKKKKDEMDRKRKIEEERKKRG